jgi:hypothetical protein
MNDAPRLSRSPRQAAILQTTCGTPPLIEKGKPSANFLEAVVWAASRQGRKSARAFIIAAFFDVADDVAGNRRGGSHSLPRPRRALADGARSREIGK